MFPRCQLSDSYQGGAKKTPVLVWGRLFLFFWLKGRFTTFTSWDIGLTAMAQCDRKLISLSSASLSWQLVPRRQLCSGDFPGPFCLVLCHFLRVVLICRVRSGSQHLVLSISTHGKGGEEVGASPLLTTLGRSGSHAQLPAGRLCLPSLRGCLSRDQRVDWGWGSRRQTQKEEFEQKEVPKRLGYSWSGGHSCWTPGVTVP